MLRSYFRICGCSFIEINREDEIFGKKDKLVCRLCVNQALRQINSKVEKTKITNIHAAHIYIFIFIYIYRVSQEEENQISGRCSLC